MIDYDIVKDDIREMRQDIRTIRDGDMKDLRARMHTTENHLAASSQLIAETIVNLSRAIDDMEIIKSKQEDTSKITKKIEIVTSHWKMIAIIIIVSILFGFLIDHGIKDAIKLTAKLLVPDKIVKAAEIVNNG